MIDTQFPSAWGKRLLKEPLTIFVVISAAIFMLDTVREKPEEDAGLQETMPGMELSTIIVTQALVDGLEEEFSWLEGRDISEQESQVLVSDWLNEEIIFRHALQQEMHLRDGKMREHLIEKMTLLWAGLPDEPDESEALNYYMDHIEDYYSEPRVSFNQVFFDEIPPDPDNVLERLRAGEDVAGDGYWLGDDFDDYSESILRTSFGGDFYLALSSASLGQWIGPLQSPRGYHYVNVSGVAEPKPLKFADVYERVRMSMMGAEQQRRIDARVDVIRKDFSVLMENDGA